MSAELAAHWDYLEGQWRAAQAAPLSRRRAYLVVYLIDAQVDRLFACSGKNDVLAFRAELIAQDDALASVLDLAAQREGGPRLEVQTIKVPLANYGQLSVEDFMVSLYNDHSVQRLMLVGTDRAPELAHPVLAAAIERLSEIQASLSTGVL
jgi:hypothetical protein